MGFDFVDAAEVVRFDDDGSFNADVTNDLLSEKLKDKHTAVIPGFYGAKADGEVVTFSRGGSDITGSLVALAVGADLYENWTDVSGFLIADPRIVKNPKSIETITYKELRELSYMGASVLHEDAISRYARRASRSISAIRTSRKTKVLLSSKAHAASRNTRSQVLPAQTALPRSLLKKQ